MFWWMWNGQHCLSSLRLKINSFKFHVKMFDICTLLFLTNVKKFAYRLLQNISCLPMILSSFAMLAILCHLVNFTIYKDLQSFHVLVTFTVPSKQLLQVRPLTSNTWSKKCPACPPRKSSLHVVEAAQHTRKTQSYRGLSVKQWFKVEKGEVDPTTVIIQYFTTVRSYKKPEWEELFDGPHWLSEKSSGAEMVFFFCFFLAGLQMLFNFSLRMNIFKLKWVFFWV